MAAAQSGKRKFRLIGSVILVLALGIGAAAWWWFFLGGAGVNTPAQAAVGTSTGSSAKPMYYNLDPFTVNLKSNEFGDRLLYVGITLEVSDDATRRHVQEYLPQVRNRLLMVLSGQEAGSLISREGKQKLAGLIRGSLNEPLADGRGRLHVEDVLFTQFIVQ